MKGVEGGVAVAKEELVGCKIVDIAHLKCKAKEDSYQFTVSGSGLSTLKGRRQRKMITTEGLTLVDSAG